jgi:hypothetical protein
LDAKPSSYVTILFKTMASTTAHLLHAKLLIVLIVMGPCQAQAFRLLLQDLEDCNNLLIIDKLFKPKPTLVLSKASSQAYDPSNHSDTFPQI